MRRSHEVPICVRLTHAQSVKPSPPPTIPVREVAVKKEVAAPDLQKTLIKTALVAGGKK